MTTTGAYVTAVISLLAGAAVVHAIYKPDLTIHVPSARKPGVDTISGQSGAARPPRNAAARPTFNQQRLL